MSSSSPCAGRTSARSTSCTSATRARKRPSNRNSSRNELPSKGSLPPILSHAMSRTREWAFKAPFNRRMLHQATILSRDFSRIGLIKAQATRCNPGQPRKQRQTTLLQGSIKTEQVWGLARKVLLHKGYNLGRQRSKTPSLCCLEEVSELAGQGHKI